MVIRIEYILVISLIILSFFIFTKKPDSINIKESNSSKELLFEKLHLFDINESGINNELIAIKIVKYKEYFEAKNINITHQKIYNIIAQKAIYKDGLLSVEDNITFRKDSIISFKTNSLIYKNKEKLLYTKDGFIMDFNGSKVIGTNLKYNLKDGKIWADKIHAKILYK